MSVVAKFRADPAAVVRWRMASAAAGLTLSAWIRGVADHAAAGRADLAAVAAELVRLRRDLNGSANNLNQAVRVANTMAQAGQLPDARALRDAIEGSRSAMEAAAGAIRDAMRGGMP